MKIQLMAHQAVANMFLNAKAELLSLHSTYKVLQNDSFLQKLQEVYRNPELPSLKRIFALMSAIRCFDENHAHHNMKLINKFFAQEIFKLSSQVSPSELNTLWEFLTVLDRKLLPTYPILLMLEEGGLDITGFVVPNQHLKVGHIEQGLGIDELVPEEFVQALNNDSKSSIQFGKYFRSSVKNDLNSN